jgi:hypothetical protein
MEVSRIFGLQQASHVATLWLRFLCRRPPQPYPAGLRVRNGVLGPWGQQPQGRQSTSEEADPYEISPSLCFGGTMLEPHSMGSMGGRRDSDLDLWGLPSLGSASPGAPSQAQHWAANRADPAKGRCRCDGGTRWTCAYGRAACMTLSTQALMLEPLHSGARCSKSCGAMSRAAMATRARLGSLTPPAARRLQWDPAGAPPWRKLTSVDLEWYRRTGKYSNICIRVLG